MKKIVLGFIMAVCGTNIMAANVDDFIGTWKKSSSTGPNYFIIKKEGSQLFAVHYSKNVLTEKITELVYLAKYDREKLRISDSDFQFDGHLENHKPVLMVIGERYEKFSPSTIAPQKE